MTDLHKVRLKYPAVAWSDMAFAQQIGKSQARYLNSDAALQKLAEIYDWLEQSDRKTHYVNVYDNTDDDTGHGELIVVLNDRNTALMMKLALS
ncbi:hypothetical protein U5A82_06195 [Sphingobium sp. CR2-8]|uniref:hypothetical protein n=1 Tax=Sphingobium sp. CR2-8 TaxID=1306534 RepID=UPI002DB8CBD0|nr:hypothetical protein [Sphingobium sp. CR2-8]MEC3910079.1 hypothetical protein [Sphingobium sp. CR2-8]